MNKGKDNKPHIGIYGRRNVGKSSFINALTGTDTAIISDIAGTTTDPVKKSIEIFGIGPAILVDTAGIDDTGELGKKRIRKTQETIAHIDLAIVLISNNIFDSFELTLIQKFDYYKVDYVIIHNKEDVEKLSNNTLNKIKQHTKAPIETCSVLESSNIAEVIELLKISTPQNAYQKTSLLGNIIGKNDIVMLITPVDSEAPEGRMILPQAMAIRDVLDNNAVNIVLKETEVEAFFSKNDIKPNLVITDSQAFNYVSEIIPRNIPLTGFSVLFAHIRGPFEDYVKGAEKISKLNDGDKILILESCVHQVSCEDIGRFKLPNWIRNFSGKKLEFDVAAGLSEIKNPITDYSLVIQCGGCMITKKQLISRLKPALDAEIAVTNYGIAIAYMNGILERAIEPFMINESVIHE
ncbi:MAG: [FeFe] hydrogenase H-cluster maturation GTPase HydF [Lutibacter sp.]|uniref:[FeFe] hydrogenase H-cluster maturation GTPase HydF n=1 Tax=Lutibacter sp. TaxID=1925666 RepID=UPI0017C7C1C2|nr:[FeFe] hydrogenase H-cluster maturation GTPase HydF [Lutibacter sp.]MBT8318387.1 [FeFe] hydrogenase H-cluster maturation GTPase HydF [Lutibacter sp.]NNJ59245.1 [FeFe] hydrogenase H-cluster maturation GTPase HydF [Lutibacter sp.]